VKSASFGNSESSCQQSLCSLIVFQTLRHSSQQFLAQFRLFLEHALRVPQHLRLADLSHVFAGFCGHFEQVRQWVVVHYSMVQKHDESDVTSALIFRGRPAIRRCNSSQRLQEFL
jgi:hypothetical protein